jgi:hypothetical protein
MANAAGFARGARLLVAVAWAGSLWALGFVAAPTVFRMVGSTEAGDIVGALLERQAWIGIACAVVLAALVHHAADLDARRRRSLFIVIGSMLACALVVYLGLQPAMARLREAAGPAGIRASENWTLFAAMHGVSQLVNLIESVLAAVLVLKVK